MTISEKKIYIESAKGLLAHLDSKLTEQDGYPDTPSWGYAFSFLAGLKLSTSTGLSFARRSINHLYRQDYKHPNFSWEFVVFALERARHFSTFKIRPEFSGYHAKGTRMFNWYLLREHNKLSCGVSSHFDQLKLRLKLGAHQGSSGFFFDEFRTRSLQYHAFCLFVIANQIQLCQRRKWMEDRFVKGMHYSMDQILSDGTSLYLGRGQEQIFGYGALVYSMAFYRKHFGALDVGKVSAVNHRLLASQRPDGSFPLVIRSREPELANISFSSHKPPGWFGYNTLYDYQPFLAYCLLEAGELL